MRSRDPDGPGPVGTDARDAADDQRILVLTAAAVLAVFSLAASAQAVYIHGAGVAVEAVVLGVPSFLLRTLVNALAVVLALGLCVWTRLHHLTGGRAVRMGALIAVVTALTRFALQNLAGVYSGPAVETAIVEIAAGTIIVAFALGFAAFQMRARSRLRAQERAHARQRMRASAALVALAEEELRVRRSVAESLHGGLQSQLVMLEVRLDRLARRWRDGGGDARDAVLVDEIRAELDAVREREVRQVSQLLYPAGADIGVAFALRHLVRRLPPEISVRVEIDDTLDTSHGMGERAGDAASVIAWRVALVRAAEEAISNALRHGGAATIDVTLRAVRSEGARDRVVLTVQDDGSGFADSPVMRGLARSRERLEALGGRQSIEALSSGGVRMTAELPFPAHDGSSGQRSGRQAGEHPLPGR